MIRNSHSQSRHRVHHPSLLVAVVLATSFVLHAVATPVTAAEEGFRRLTPVPSLKILNAAEAFPGGGYTAENIILPASPTGQHPEYASNAKAAATFIDFDLGRPTPVGAIRHVQRATPDVVSEANLVFADTPDFKSPLATVKIKHEEKAGGTTFAAFAPVAARYVRWQVTALIPGSSPNVGGQRMELFVAGDPEPAPRAIGIDARTVPIVDRKDGVLTQRLRLSLDYPYGQAAKATVRVEGQEPRTVDLKFSGHSIEYTVAAADAARTMNVAVEIGGEAVASRAVTIQPARMLTVYLLPHSHTDIGYTAIQTDIEEKQINNLLQGMADARRTAGYPEGARFVWNVEVLWGADLFLQRLPEKHRIEFFDAVKRGQVSLNGMYLNELTGLCRPEELVRLFKYATQLGRRCGVAVDSAMISDVPGYTWGTVTAMAQAGIRYFSVAPNYFDRIGTILVEWENKPFWWIGPDGRSKVLVWIPFWGYAMSHRYGKMSPQLVEEFCEGLQKRKYPYDIAYARWAGHGDNAVPDPIICDFVKQWNAEHASPRFVISSTSEAFRAFEKRYGDKLPEVRGDWTPYWEDGAGSSSAETAMNRASSDRLVQAEALWAMLYPSGYPKGQFEDAWRNVLLYSEHTWGAWCSISDPANPFTIDQWTIKQSYATMANLQSRQLLTAATQAGLGFRPLAAPAAPEAGPRRSRFDVFNTGSWPRTEIVVLPRELSETGDCVTDDQNRPIPTQRLASNELAVLVRDLPPFAGRRYTLSSDKPLAEGKATANGTTLDNGLVRVGVDPQTGGIVELRAAGIDLNLADTSGGQAVNEYLYLVGDQLSALRKNGPAKVSVRDRGPLVASLVADSDAPGCQRLSREMRIVTGGDHVEMINTVDKKRIEAKSYHAADGKESLNFGFPMNVPGGDVRLDLPLGMIRPESDQMPSACKNWLTIGRWADVANRDFGVTWVTLDAPLVQLGGLTATLLNSQANPEIWRKKIDPTQKLYCWAMNNHWGTNYRAYQEGPVVFRFALRPHRESTPAEATRLATSLSQPLVAAPARGAAPPAASLLRVEPESVLVTALKPSDDGRAWIVRLFNASGNAADAKIVWGQPASKAMSVSDTSEKPGQRLEGPIAMPGWGLSTVRVER
jgi:alpha-mannosidase